MEEGEAFGEALRHIGAVAKLCKVTLFFRCGSSEQCQQLAMMLLRRRSCMMKISFSLALALSLSLARSISRSLALALSLARALSNIFKISLSSLPGRHASLISQNAFIN